MLVLAPARARADEPTLVVVLVEPGSDTLAERVEAELRALGFDVQTTSPTNSGAGVMEDAARAAHAAAAIRIVRSDQKAQVWVADRVTGKTLLRELEVARGEDPDGVLAVRAVELLRASLLEVEASHPSRGEVKESPVVRRIVATSRSAPEPPRSTLALAVGLGPQVMPSLSPSLHALVGMAWMPSRFGLEATFLLPLVASEVCASEGCARLTTGLLGGGMRVALTSDVARVHPELGLGFAGAFVHAEGSPVPPYLASSSNALVAAAYARAGLSVSLSRHFRLGIDAWIGAALPPTPVRFSGRQVALWGGPFASLILRAEVWLP
ncbi:MAG TPA: hypothetical protein VLM85_12825 [Polyangiaceae bacterium]|nr:hypothetical protein [Polyangiaceae bacterium]